MSASPNGKLRGKKRQQGALKSLKVIETDPGHHLAGPFRPQTPLDAQMPETPIHLRRSPRSPTDKARWSTESRGLWNDIKSLRWVVVPSSSLKLLLIPIALWANWELLAPYVAKGLPNPFASLLFISHPTPSPPDDPRYRKGYLDLLFIAYYVIVWSWFRQVIILHFWKPFGRWFGVKKEAKLDRLGEQGHAMTYFTIMAIWGYRIMQTLPTWWYQTQYFWIDYPHWEMKPELKAYYLMQMAYWIQQLMVLVLKLEKPRKDYTELVAHHLVTLWLIGWSYLINLTLIGNAVFLSMDLPDIFLAMSKILNYIQWEKTKITVFVFFLGIWTYFRHWLNLVMLWSVWSEFHLMPETSKRWFPDDGVWMVWWMQYQVFVPILLLQFLNLFWYILILRIAMRAVRDVKVTDVRSDDEDDGEPDEVEDKKNN
ncbi:TLC domain-containing protein [Abortiporus biennis]|nr:TLC domain-containing protein [Abortiporus biennis]